VNSENVVKQLRALWRTDRIIAEIRMRHMLVGLGLRAFAALMRSPAHRANILDPRFADIGIDRRLSRWGVLWVIHYGRRW